MIQVREKSIRKLEEKIDEAGNLDHQTYPLIKNNID